MAKFSLIALISSFMLGCQTVPQQISPQQHDSFTAPQVNIVDIRPLAEQKQVAENVKEGKAKQGYTSLNGEPEYTGSQGAYKSAALSKHIGAYVQNMTQDLIANMRALSDTTPLGVTNFALIDSNLQQTNLLGQQMAESFVHELHKFNVPVIDYKATQSIRVTSNGDFFLSRDFLELESQLPIEYVLTGTMTRHRGGYLVNARILQLESKAVVASAQMMIPYYVVDALLPSTGGNMGPGQDGVRLIQG